MTTYVGEFKFRVSGCESTDEFEKHLDEVLDFLSEDERVFDADYTASLEHRRVLFSAWVEADDQAAGFGLLSSALRAAIHAAEGGTPGWEHHFSETGANVRPAEHVDA